MKFLLSNFSTLRKIRETQGAVFTVQYSEGFMSVNVLNHSVVVILEWLLYLMYRQPF